MPQSVIPMGILSRRRDIFGRRLQSEFDLSKVRVIGERVGESRGKKPESR